MNIYKPDKVINRYTDLDINYLIQNNIKLLICDIDNTLIPHDTNILTNNAITFLDNIISNKIEVVLVSNNTNKRISSISNMKYKYYSFALKPFKRVFKKIFKDYKIKSNNVAILGDQLLTDIIGGNRVNILTILTKPLVEKDIVYTKITRILEKKMIDKLKKEGIYE